MRIVCSRTLALLGWVVSVSANIPVASHVFVSNGSAYMFSPSRLEILNVSETIDTASPATPKAVALPFDQSSAYTPISSDDNLIVLSGDCGRENTAQLWHFKSEQQEWEELGVSADSSVSSWFLSAAFSFSSTVSINDTRFYTFGGMCPNVTSDEWTSNAEYTNQVTAFSPDSSYVSSFPSSSYDASVMSAAGPPVKEAGLTITPLTPSYSESSPNSKSQQQSFVLLGGHTPQAFINMSQVALFSLPQASWSYQAIAQPSSGGADLVRRSSNEVEPRSGHTAVLNSDGSKIIVFGGWVGDISTPAEPQLAILELGRGYGGDGKWAWTIPQVSDNPIASDQGIYGHGAAMLDGDVMLIWGGYSTSSSPARRSVSSKTFLYNTTSSSFIPTYTNPAFTAATAPKTPKHSSGLHTSSQKAGLSAGLILGLLALAGIFAFYIFYSRRLRHKRLSRDSEVRDLALGPDRLGSAEFVGGGIDGRGGHFPIPRPTSWANRHERPSAPGDDYPWAPVAAASSGRPLSPEDGPLQLDTSMPTRVKRLSGSRANPSRVNGMIHTIDEEDEGSRASASLRRAKRPSSTSSDPFKDPSPLPTIGIEKETELTRSQSDTDKMLRDKDFQNWTQDWDAAGKALDEVHNTSPTKSTHTALERQTEKESDKSERTQSNLSDHSTSTSTMSSASIQRSVFSALALSRTFSLRSSSAGAVPSAGYTLFANAAAAMTGRATLVHHPGPSGTIGSVRGSVRGDGRTVSLNAGSSTADPGPRQRLTHSRATDRSDTFSSAITSLTFNPADPDSQGLGPRSLSSRQSGRDTYATPPESPVKDRYPGLGLGLGLSAGLGGFMGGVRRALTGVVERRVRGYEDREKTASPTRKGLFSTSPTRTRGPEMSEVDPYSDVAPDGLFGPGSPRRATSASAALWKGKRGARDWDVDVPSKSGSDRPTVRRVRTVAPTAADMHSPSALEVEAARGPGNKNVPGPPGTILRRKAVPLAHADGRVFGSGPLGEITDADRERVRARNRAQTLQQGATGGGDVDPDWDVEAAVQQRLVQVMFTVPKERLRVVNADVEHGDGEDDDGVVTGGGKGDDGGGGQEGREGRDGLRRGDRGPGERIEEDMGKKMGEKG